MSTTLTEAHHIPAALSATSNSIDMVPPLDRTGKQQQKGLHAAAPADALVSSPITMASSPDALASVPARVGSPSSAGKRVPPAIVPTPHTREESRSLPSPPPSDDHEHEQPSRLLTSSPPPIDGSEPGPAQVVDTDDELEVGDACDLLDVTSFRMPPPKAANRNSGGRAATTTEDGFLNRRASSETAATTSRLNRQFGGSLVEEPTTFSAQEPISASPTTSRVSYVSPDGHLQPPQTSSSMRMPRRNTIGSGSAAASRPAQLNRNQSQLQASFSEDKSFGALDDDILQQAEQIRRERLNRRAKAQQEAAAGENPLSRKATDLDEEKVLVGNLIKEGHVNYILMYNMLTGIRTAVSRCQAKMHRDVTPEDYTAAHKYSFDLIGNELTPSAKYDFKFKDYAPWVFRNLREDHFGLDPADYLLSLTSKYILSELGSPGKSGSFFYFSRDYRFIIKTIHHSEHKYLLSILKDYHQHVRDNPHTLISRFYGLHRVKLPRGRKIHFVIMNNLFPPHRDIHETYDLKGSTVGREYPEEKARENPKAVLKDLNWIDRGRTLELGPMKRALLSEQLRRDAEFLRRIYVMDYSLLIGIHNMQRGNRDNLRRNTLRVFQPEFATGSVAQKPAVRRKMSILQSPSSQQPEAKMRRVMRQSDPRELTERESDPTAALADRQHLVFYQDEGGYRATDELNGDLSTIYYLGVIDILTPYNTFKKVEHLWKGLKADRHKISPVPPPEYSARFLDFLNAVMRGGGGGQRFKTGGDKGKEKEKTE